ncbi:hypothetical protein D3C71_2206400 [compost metagenome]
MPGGREAQTLVFTDKQLNAKIRLQLSDSGGQVGRNTMHLLRRLGDAPGLRDGVKHFELS